MWRYVPPLREMRFVIEEVLRIPERWPVLQGRAEIDIETALHVLEEAGRFAAEVIGPINAAGDFEGCSFSDGQVCTPAGYRQALRAFVDAGWPLLACDEEDGGQALPHVLSAALNEMLAAANHAWTMYPGLAEGAYRCLKAHARQDIKDRYLGKIAAGEWLATMCLTEPQAGSDLGAVCTRAAPAGDGTWQVTGSKIFTSGGEHDLTDNIVHLVLCRLPDAPAGGKGLSLILVPKVLPDGKRNAVRCDGIEKKMGIKGSATCVMSFEQATGWLIGQPHCGLAAMFVMMNSARLHVALQGVAHLEAATQNAIRYANERTQFGAALSAQLSVRRTLWRLKALTSGARVCAFRIAQLLDEADYHRSAAERERAQQLLGVLTPIAKAFFTHVGHHGANDALQVWGGYGYVHDYGIEQTVRDSRIAMIYEGANAIQAIDLVTRKVIADGGHAMELLLEEMDSEVVVCRAVEGLEMHAETLQRQVRQLRGGVDQLLHSAGSQWPIQVADDFLHGAGFTLLTWAWCRIARATSVARSGDLHGEQWQASDFGIRHVLPESEAHWQRLGAGECELPAIAD
ncbi:acyl-CoA dehydrogenase [Burkholderia sp. BE17]|nr:acyl-CoA dehydrogenase [Burkholderia sp. BE17]